MVIDPNSKFSSLKSATIKRGMGMDNSKSKIMEPLRKPTGFFQRLLTTYRMFKSKVMHWLMKMKITQSKNPKPPPTSVGQSMEEISVRKDGKLYKFPIDALSCPRSGFGQGISVFRNVVNDPSFPAQLYLHLCHPVDEKHPKYDLGVVDVWKTGNYGKGIVILVVDTGIETTHIELKDNYSPYFGLDVVSNTNNPNPGKKPLDCHGTNVASVAVMKANNNYCGAGIAPEATIGAVRYLDNNESTASDEVTSRALLFRSDQVNVVSCSWSVANDGYSFQYPSDLIRNTFKVASEKVILIFSCGNGKTDGDHCGLDVYAASIYTITVASAEYNGEENEYSERCASIMVTSYSGFGNNPYNVVAANIDNGCILTFGGTSAAAPMISGIVALTLKENKELSSRDMAHLFAWNNNVQPLEGTPECWHKNAAGFWVSDCFGFELANAKGMADMAKGFVHVPPLHTCVMITMPFNYIYLSPRNPSKITIECNGCFGQNSEVNYIEYVQVTVYIVYPYRGAIEAKLTSPSKTVAILLSSRPKDNSNTGLQGWTFSSLMTWGEKPNGTWLLEISAQYGTWGNGLGYVYGAQAVVHGTKTKPNHYLNGARNYGHVNIKNKS